MCSSLVRAIHESASGVMDLPPVPQLRPCYVNARPRTRIRIAGTRYNVRDLRIQSSFHHTRACTGSPPLLRISNAFKTVNIKMSAEHPINNPCLYLSWSQQVTLEVGREKTYVTDNHRADQPGNGLFRVCQCCAEKSIQRGKQIERPM